MQILDVRPMNKGYLQAMVNVKVSTTEGIDLIINKIMVFSKNGTRWINFPQESYEKDGEKKYYSLNRISDPAQMQRFQQDILTSLDQYKAKPKIDQYAPNEEVSLPF